MAKQRMVNTKFWVDDYISELNPTEKLLFLYFLTNPFTDICGIYEVPLRSIVFDTGIDKEEVKKAMVRFESDHKIVYRRGWVYIKNFAKHQLNNPKVQKGILRSISVVPPDVLHDLGIVYDSLSHLNLNLNLNSNLNNTVSAEASTDKPMNTYDENKMSYDGPIISLEGEPVEKEKEGVKKELSVGNFNKFRKYFVDEYEKVHGIRPVASKGEYFSFIKARKMFSVRELQELVVYFLKDKKSAEHPSINACLSGDSINRWQLTEAKYK